jgi:hypothetical protein
MEIKDKTVKIFHQSSSRLAGGLRMTSTLKVEIASVCAAFAFITAILAVVW